MGAGYISPANSLQHKLSLIGSLLRWGFLIWELIFIYCGLFVLVLVGFFLCCFFFHYVSAKFHLWPSSGDFTATSDRNAESCNLSITPRFWPSKPLAGLGRIWNRYLLTMLTWNRRDSTPLSAAPRATKGDQQLWKAVITGNTVTRLIIPIRGRGKITWRRPEVKFGRNVVKEETTQKKKKQLPK